MMGRFQVLSTPVLLVQLKYKHLCFNSHDLDVLNEFISLLSLFAEVTTAVQVENSPSISMIAPSILAIYNDLKKEKENVRYTKKLCDALLSSLLSRFGALLEQLEIDLNETNVTFNQNKRFYELYKDPVFMFTPFLDGMFKLDWINRSCLHDETKSRLCEKIKQLIMDLATIIEHAHDKSASCDKELMEERQQVETGQTLNIQGLKRKSLFSNLYDDQQMPKKKPFDPYKNIKEEISNYLSSNNGNSMDLLRSTTSYHTLSKLAIKYLCIPATSASVERIFSQTGFIFRSHRARMLRQTLQQLTLLKCNASV